MSYFSTVYLGYGTECVGKLAANSGVVIGSVEIASAQTLDTINTITNVVHIDDNSGSITVDNGGTFAVQATLQSGTNGIGKLTANSGITIGAVEIASSQTLATVTNLSQLGGAAIAMGTGARSSGTQRVTIATDDVVPASQSGTWNITNVSGTVSLPTGAATAAKQPALGVAGTASADVITIQGITSMTPLLATLSGTNTVDTITNVVHIDDNSGSLTVDNSGTFAVQATIASGATSIAKAEDVASADADVGVPAMAVRKATPANTSGTDGDYEMLQVSAGRLWTSAVIDTALPAGSALIGKTGIDQTTPGTTNAVAIAQIGSGTVSTVATGVQKVGIADSGGNALVSIVNATDSTGTGIQAVGLLAQFDNTSPTTITENQFGNVRMSANRNVFVTLRDAAGNERGANCDASGNLNVAFSSAAQVVGNIASGATDSGNPVKMGGKGVSTTPTVVTAGQRVDGYFDRSGRMVVRTATQVQDTFLKTSSSTTATTLPSTGTTATCNFGAAGSGIKNVCTSVSATLASTSAPTAGTLILQLFDGSNSGTVMQSWVLSLPATAGANTGLTITDLFIPGTANTAMTLCFNAGLTNVYSVVSMTGITITE